MKTELHKSFGWTGWPALLAGLYPFLYFGPLVVLLAYPYPYPAWRVSAAFQVILPLLSMLPVAIGFSIGWWKRFPLWSYPYTCLVVLFLSVAGGTLLKKELIWPIDGPIIVGWILALVLVALLAWLTHRSLPLQDLWQDIRRDWTRLSLGLLIVPAIFFSAIDHEEDPILTLSLIGPTIILVITALLGLLARSKERRALILGVGMVLVILVRLLSGKWFYLIYWLISLAFVFAPYMVLSRFQPARTSHQG